MATDRRPAARATQKQVDDAVRHQDERHKAYATTFQGAAGDYVLAELAKFCRAHESTFEEDPRYHALLEGRREVWLQIQSALRLTGDELFALYAPPQLVIVKEKTDG